jgi:hypothetical protein
MAEGFNLRVKLEHGGVLTSLDQEGTVPSFSGSIIEERAALASLRC